MEQEPIVLSYQHPDNIDGTPHEVAEQCLDQLDEIATQLGEVLDATARQVRNAVLDELADDEATPKDAGAALLAWEQGTHGRRLDMLKQIAARLPQLAHALRRAL